MAYTPRFTIKGNTTSKRPEADVQLKQDLADAFHHEERKQILSLHDGLVQSMKNRTYRRQDAVVSLFTLIDTAAKKHKWAADWNERLDDMLISELAEDIVSLWEDEHPDLAHFIVQVKAKPGRIGGAKWENFFFNSVFFSESDAKDFVTKQRRLDGTPASAWRVIED